MVFCWSTSTKLFAAVEQKSINLKQKAINLELKLSTLQFLVHKKLLQFQTLARNTEN